MVLLFEFLLKQTRRSNKKEDQNSMSGLSGSILPRDVRKAGILRKLKTMKKKYFVLRTESESGPARLEYYDNEKKFKAGSTAKRSIPIKTCFNINRKVDAKHKYAIALYTKDDCFSVVTENEQSQEDWLNALLELQLDGPCMNGGAKLKPKFEHVWQVTVGDKSLASSRNMKGLYRLCLTPSALALIKVDQTDKPETLEFPLMSIRRCGHTNNYFVIELGRSSVTGAGELWLETEDVVIAQNMHEVTLNAMKSCREHEDLGPLARPRSASNSENSRPIATRRPVAVVSPQAISYGGIRDRCDSMPSRPRTISEGQEINNRGYYAPPGYTLDSLRPHSGFSRTVSYSPPALPNPLSPVSATCSTDSAGSSLSIDEFDAGQQTDFAHSRYIHSHPTDGALHTEPPIKEEQLDEYMPMSIGSDSGDSYLHMAPMSSSAPTGPSVYLNLNCSDSSSLPPVIQDNDYMEMKSPTEGYINMSPVGATLDVQGNKSSSLDSSNDANQTKDGYIHMAPIRDHYSSSLSSTGPDGYLDMAPLSSSLPKAFPVITNHTASLSSRKDSSSKLSEISVSSPSSTNLEDFPLDKVKSFLADTDDSSCDSYIRPVRAYSMGSRPQPKKTHLPVQVDGSRIRAYSVGSQASGQKKSNPLERELGNLMRIDPRTGTKSSSAPLLNNRPPRIRSSTSRGDVGEDLMEIDYNRIKYTTGGIDLLDSNFTIEPVGRSRSGSYSSSPNNAMKLLHDRDKAKSHSTGHSCNPNSNDSETPSDYLSMSPISDNSKCLSRSSASVSSPITVLNHNATKMCEPLHPPGDYVSLDPTCTYQTISNNKSSGMLKPASGSVLRHQRSRSPSSLASTPPTVISHIEVKNIKSLDQNKGVVDSNSLTTKQSNSEQNASSDYMCMNYNQKSTNSQMSPEGGILDNSCTDPETKDSAELLQNLSNNKKSHSLPPLQQVKESSLPSSPTSKSPPIQSQNTSSDSVVPKTPPPSPYYGAMPNDLSGAPLVENVVRRLSQPSNKGSTLSDPNSRPNSVCGEIRLNYASLELPPASEEDIKGTGTKLRKSVDGETKEAPLTYAQIDFSPVKQKSFQDSENLSHL
ncbi:insulin receptor substrate 1-like isoform X2 [Argiope bruennichi]|uniref:insulin receptor substrate 1-like isoform X2 n=1 Tax=Argiope bruennichi TaxID=94029 RepID=UPI002493EAB2|nr:insulin receptor substrate 1-like isoform X2 [Argiope bruennichi]